MTETPNDGGERHPDGWAAWGKRAGDPLDPATQEPLESGETEPNDSQEQPPATES